MKPGWTQLRTCHSDDPTDALENGDCRPSSLEYPEVRTVMRGWDTQTMGSWLLQILMSELLGVPASIEAGAPDLIGDFYNMRYPSPNSNGLTDAECLVRASEMDNGECITSTQEKDSSYVPCCHISPEVWEERRGILSPLVSSGVMEPFSELNALAYQTWMIPKFAVERDPTLGIYTGLQGEENRKKLAETFLTPTTWKQYCDEVSDSELCEDDVAVRAPITPEEEESMFAEGLYIGHFRQLPEQNCTLHPTTCYGHFADYPCTWATFFRQQAHWNNISMKSTGSSGGIQGYSSTQLHQMWAAANATKSPLMMLWWTPDTFYQEYFGTEAELTGVRLPPPSQECLDSRLDYPDRCESDENNHIGNSAGCDYSTQSLKKGLSRALQEKWGRDSDLPSELWSPAYEAAQNYELTEFQMGTIMKNRDNLDTGDPGMDFRLATCQWVVDNFDLFQSFVPTTYPRVVQELKIGDDNLFNTALAMALFAVFAVVDCMVLTAANRRNKAIYHIKPEFLFLILMGMLFISGAAIANSAPPSNESCTAIPWFYNIGYCMLILPLVFRVYAILRVLNRGKQMKRVKVGKRRLLWSMVGAIVLVIIYNLTWTLVDTPDVFEKYELSGSANEQGETVVEVSYYCGSDSPLWVGLSITVQVCMLCLGTIWAFMTMRVGKGGFIDSLQLTLLILFVSSLVRLAVFLFRDSFDAVDTMGVNSLISSAETITTLVVFIVPKLLDKDKVEEKSEEAMPDLFPRTTILYADISGFAAWSSVRSPQQVFKFLESIYSEIDILAEKKGVMKVETSGETYVAVTGIPREREDHAVAMCRFAMEIMATMAETTQRLDVVYGPDTADLSLRIGLHSGAVTGGYLKGKGARFQLFGDNAGIARQVCLVGNHGCILISEETAMLLRNEGKEHWLEKRGEMVPIKGHSDKQTYWLTQQVGRSVSVTGRTHSIVTDDKDVARLKEITADASDRSRRLIDWNVEVLHKLLKQIEARRLAKDSVLTGPAHIATASIRMATDAVTLSSPGKRRVKSMSVSVHNASIHNSSIQNQSFHSDSAGNDTSTETSEMMPLEEVVEVIPLPKFDHKVAKKQKDWEEVVIPESVLGQLRSFVSYIAERYNDNPFHSFAHASHVVMSSIKYMNRIVAPNDLDIEEDESHIKTKAAAALHDHTYGITSDPLTQFACVLSALIHDVDHPGVPNGQLIKEDPAMANTYKQRSVAEQNSFDIAWKLLMESKFDSLRAYICGDNEGLVRLRQLVINGVMATDLGDKELKTLRNGRWYKAFQQSEQEAAPSPESNVEDVNRKATIVIEHLIQAADVSHTMQHWDIYREWNSKLFSEMYLAYRQGRSDTNPAEGWYQGEIGFFDFYIIPLSQKLNDCGVFGVTSDENLNYAKLNRELWVSLGKAATEEMLERCEKEYDRKMAQEVDNQIEIFTEEDMI